ncbi:MAG: class I SAM-dependent methyltransferase, partial [Thaumarchaeota archaeon]|nr:class I SAM-dependent methyltransferase [Nitrososphaerota archaeon]
MQPLDLQYWDEYASNFSSHYNEEMAKFIKDLALSLRAQNILEVGCSAGNDLKLFPQGMNVNGIDVSEIAISIARENLPEFSFKVGEITAIPFENDSMDIVFTRNVFNHLETTDIKKSVDELFRVSRKYIFNIESFSENEEEKEKKKI